AALEVGILTRSGVLVELLDLGDKVGGEVLVQREVAGHLAEALDAFLDRGGELFDGVALDDVRRGLRIRREREGSTPVFLHALVVDVEREPVGPVAVVRVPVEVGHRAVLVVALLVDVALAVLVDLEEGVAVEEPGAVVGAGAGDGLLEEALVAVDVVQVAELRAEGGGDAEEVALVGDRRATAVVRRRHEVVHHVVVAGETTGTEDDALLRADGDLLRRSDRAGLRGRLGGSGRGRIDDRHLDADDLTLAVGDDAVDAVVEVDPDAVLLGPRLVAVDHVAAAARATLCAGRVEGAVRRLDVLLVLLHVVDLDLVEERTKVATVGPGDGALVLEVLRGLSSGIDVGGVEVVVLLR